MFLHPQLDSSRGHIRLRKKISLKRLITSPVCFYTTKLCQHAQRRILMVETMVTGWTTSRAAKLHGDGGEYEDVSERRKGKGFIDPFSYEFE